MRLGGLGQWVGLVDLDFDGARAHDVEEGACGFLKLRPGRVVTEEGGPRDVGALGRESRARLKSVMGPEALPKLASVPSRARLLSEPSTVSAPMES